MSHHELLMTKAAELVGAASAADLDVSRHPTDDSHFELRGPDGVARLFSPDGMAPRLERADKTWRVDEHGTVVDTPTAASLLDSAAAAARKASAALTAGDPSAAARHAQVAVGAAKAAAERLHVGPDSG